MSSDLDPLFTRLSLANGRHGWRSLVARAEKEEWSHEQLLLTLLEEEIAHRRTMRLGRAMRAAHFPFFSTIEEFDFSYQSTLRLIVLGSLLSPDFVSEGGSVIFEGRPGRGKTHLAIAIANRGGKTASTPSSRLLRTWSTNCRSQLRQATSASRSIASRSLTC